MNVIGGANPGEGNLISGNTDNGVGIYWTGTTSNTVAGNYVGTDASGTSGLGNGWAGVLIRYGASGNLIGGDTEGERNLISGNGGPGVRDGAGVWIQDSGTMHNTVSGNYIGTDVNGAGVVSNTNGVWIGEGASYNTIGGDTPGERNLVSGNVFDGVWVDDSYGFHGTVNNVVSGNYIGTDAAGINALNTGLGIYLAADHTLIENNIIAHNNFGIALAGAAHNTLRANWVGVNAAGAPAGNQGAGVLIGHNTHHNTVGGPDLADGNTIAYNGSDGVYVWKHPPECCPSENYANTISHNSIYNNADLGIELAGGANAYMFPPLLTEVSNMVVKGIAVPNAIVEVFSDDDDEGRWFHGSTVADADGMFTFTVATSFTGTHVTATATDADGNTSEFSSPYAPRRDLVVAAIYAPQTRQGVNQPLTPLVRVGNGGTAPETFTVTAVITRASDGLLVYSDTQTIIDLKALHYRTLSFDSWTPTELGGYSFAAGLHLDTPDDDPANDHLIQDFTVVDSRVDLWSRDNSTDDGSEPAVGSVWQSPDIWVRNTADGLTDHQNPINLITNTVYIRMRNRGTLTATNATVTAYWHPPALVIGQSWWESIGTITADELAPGAVYTASMPWQPQITGVLTEPYHTCLIDVISSTQDVAPTFWDVRGSNNIEQRNVDIVASPETMLLRATSSSAVSTTFSVGNPYAGEQLVDVIVDMAGVPEGSEVRLDLQELFERWQRFGQASLTGGSIVSGTTQVLLSDSQAVIGGLPLMGEELVQVALEVSGLGGRQGQIDVSERIGGEVLGGVSLHVVGHFKLYLPIVIRNG
jgi:parallel beta-helix repeat protein